MNFYKFDRCALFVAKSFSALVLLFGQQETEERYPIHPAKNPAIPKSILGRGRPAIAKGRHS